MNDTPTDECSPYDPRLTEERLARLVRFAARGFNRSLQLRLQTEGVTFGQWIFLRILWYDDGLSQRELSQRAHLTEPTAHAALTKLERQGIVERQRVEGNRRMFRIILTDKGWALRDKLEPMAVEVNECAIAGLTLEEERSLRHGLLAIIRNLEQDEDELAERGMKMPATRTSP